GNPPGPGRHLARGDQDSLDLPDRARLADEPQAQRDVAAGARLSEELEDVARRVAHERQRARPELGGNQLARTARRDRLARLDVEELAEQVAGVEVHPVVRAALAGERPDLRLTAVIVELDPEGGLELPAERRRQGLGGR